MNLREYLMLVGAVGALIGIGVVLLGVRQLSAVQSLRRLGQAGCAGAVIIFVGSMFLLGGLVFLAAGLLVP